MRTPAIASMAERECDASLWSLGPVEHGARGVIDSLRAALGPSGTLVVPASTPPVRAPCPSPRLKLRRFPVDMDGEVVRLESVTHQQGWTQASTPSGPPSSSRARGAEGRNRDGTMRP